MSEKARDPEKPDVIDERLLFNQRHTARMLGISARAFSDWPLEPRDHSGREALYYWPDVQAERDRRREEPLRKRITGLEAELAAAGLDPDGEDVSDGLILDEERARLAAEQADKIAMENAITRKEVAYLPDIANQQARIFEMIRARALAIPTKCAPLANPEHPNIARDVVEREIGELLSEIAAVELDAESRERSGDVRGAVVDPPAAAEVNGHGVGRPKKATKPRK